MCYLIYMNLLSIFYACLIFDQVITSNSSISVVVVVVAYI